MTTKKHSRKLAIWDFNGVMDEGRIKNKGLQEFLCHRINYSLKKTKQIKKITIEDCYELYGSAIECFFEKVLPGKKEEHYSEMIKILIKSDMEIPLEKWKEHINPTKGLYSVLDKTKEKGYNNLLLTAIPNHLLDIYSKCVNLSPYFEINKTAFAVNDYPISVKRNKKNVLTHILNNRKSRNNQILKYDKIMIIGDSPSDIELKNIVQNYIKSKGRIITFQYTHPSLKFRNSGKIKPDYKIKYLTDILDKI